MQTKKQSAYEAVANGSIGYIIAVLAQLVVFPMVGIASTLGQNLKVGAAFTAISLGRTYCVRRWFNKK